MLPSEFFDLKSKFVIFLLFLFVQLHCDKSEMRECEEYSSAHRKPPPLLLSSVLLLVGLNASVLRSFKFLM